MPRKRVSYVIPQPPPTTQVQKLALPPPNTPRHGQSSPLIIPVDPPEYSSHSRHAAQRHPRHRLGVASLALDSSTQLEGRDSPEGILYTGGRDGMVVAWDLGIAHRPRKHKYGFEPESPQRYTRRDRWESLTGWEDTGSVDEDDLDDEAGLTTVGDGDILGDVTAPKKRFKYEGVVPYEEKWEIEDWCESKTTFRQCTQTHSDWVNDLLLCNYNQTVISASSDGTIKSWSPHASLPSGSEVEVHEPTLIGRHTDYVRTLTHSTHQLWIASGSLDRTIKLWDPSRSLSSTSFPTPILTLSPPSSDDSKASIYALCTSDVYGSMLVSGGPERVVRLWDTRTGKGVGKLVGHTDIVRCVVGGWGGEYLLTASADASIKLWSLRSPQKCLHTFEHHTDSVWALYSNHPRLEVFYSGDRAGNVVRVDCEGIGALAEGECVLLGRDGVSSRGMESLSTIGNSSRGEGIVRIVSTDDRWVWTASGKSSIARWRDVGRKYERLQECHNGPVQDDHLLVNGNVGKDTMKGVTYNSLVRLEIPPETYSLGSPHLSHLGFSHAQQSNGRGSAHLLPYHSAAPTPSSPIHYHSSPSQPYSQPHSPPRHLSPSTIASVSPLPLAPSPLDDYLQREVIADALPLHTSPAEIIEGDRGLTRSIILNDRIHALTVDTASEVALWDIVRGVQVGWFGHICSCAASGEKECEDEDGCLRDAPSPREALEIVRERIEGEAVVNSWSAVDTKVGDLMVHVDERAFEGECFGDEIKEGHDYDDEYRVNIGRWVLYNLFFNFVRYEVEAHNIETPVSWSAQNPYNSAMPRPRHISLTNTYFAPSAFKSPAIKSIDNTPAVPATPKALPPTSFPGAKEGLSPIAQSPRLFPQPLPETSANDPVMQPGAANALTTPRPRLVTSNLGLAVAASPTPVSPATATESDYFSHRRGTRKGSITSPTTPDDFSGWGGKEKEPNTPSKFMSRLRPWRSTRKLNGDVSTMSSLGTGGGVSEDGDDTRDILSPAEEYRTPMQRLLASQFKPPSAQDAPLLFIYPSTGLLISEEVSSGWTNLYRGHVGTTGNASDVTTLEAVMPAWLADCVLNNSIPPYVPPKISFVLMPWKGSKEELPDLSNSHSRLTASRFLRARKVSAYVQEKLEQIRNSSPRPSTSASRPTTPSKLHTDINPFSSITAPPRRLPQESYEILCNDIVLPWYMTLAAVKQFLWRQAGGELTMHYRKASSHSGAPSEPLAI